jgi:phosphoribosylaminoimidazole-succinocarboxamide synthase
VISTASLPLIHTGKVRRLYALNDPNQVLIVATDAISAYDQVLETPIPDKGAILTQLSQWWGDQLVDIVENHFLSADVPTDVQGRAIVAERLEMIPVECVARGYVTGSGWAEYQVCGAIAGLPLPEGLQHADRLPEPIFTPARKAPQGEHDENIDYAALEELVGPETAERLRDLTLRLYARGARVSAERGIILADTKFEFGRRPDGTIILADEVLTPDSSRFWDAAQWTPGAQIPSFDKQYVRDWLAYDSGWDKTAATPPPPLPRVVVQATRDRYLEAHARLTGRRFTPPKAVTPASPPPEAAERYLPKTRYLVEVMPKPEILDPQGKAVTAALARLGHEGFSVRQGKRFEIETVRPASPETLAEVEAMAQTLLANAVIENYAVTLDRPGADGGPGGRDGSTSGSTSQSGSTSTNRSVNPGGGATGTGGSTSQGGSTGTVGSTNTDRFVNPGGGATGTGGSTAPGRSTATSWSTAPGGSTIPGGSTDQGGFAAGNSSLNGAGLPWPPAGTHRPPTVAAAGTDIPSATDTSFVTDTPFATDTPLADDHDSPTEAAAPLSAPSPLALQSPITAWSSDSANEADWGQDSAGVADPSLADPDSPGPGAIDPDSPGPGAIDPDSPGPDLALPDLVRDLHQPLITSDPADTPEAHSEPQPAADRGAVADRLAGTTAEPLFPQPQDDQSRLDGLALSNLSTDLAHALEALQATAAAMARLSGEAAGGNPAAADSAGDWADDGGREA